MRRYLIRMKTNSLQNIRRGSSIWAKYSRHVEMILSGETTQAQQRPIILQCNSVVKRGTAVRSN